MCATGSGKLNVGPVVGVWQPALASSRIHRSRLYPGVSLIPMGLLCISYGSLPGPWVSPHPRVSHWSPLTHAVDRTCLAPSDIRNVDVKP